MVDQLQNTISVIQWFNYSIPKQHFSFFQPRKDGHFQGAVCLESLDKFSSKKGATLNAVKPQQIPVRDKVTLRNFQSTDETTVILSWIWEF